MLKSISINNLRGITALRLEGLGRVNVFLGGNGVGKSTVMEAVGIIGNPGGPEFLAAMSGWRDFPAASLQVDYAFRSYFPEFNVEKSPSLEFENEDGKHGIAIRALRPAGNVLNVTVRSAGQGTVDRELDGVEVEYTGPTGTKHVASARLLAQGFQEQGNTNALRLGSFVIHARRSSSPPETAAALVHLAKTQQEGLLVEVMQGLDGRVKKLLAGMVGNNVPVVFVDVGGPRILPASAMGDGFGRVCLIATALVYPLAKMVAVDEIDSGLDPAVMTKLWGSYIKLYQQFGSQMFCTMSNEKAGTSLKKAFAAAPDDLRIFKLERDGEGQVKARRVE